MRLFRFVSQNYIEVIRKPTSSINLFQLKGQVEVLANELHAFRAFHILIGPLASLNEGLDGGSWYSLITKNLAIYSLSLKFWLIH